MAVLLIPGHLSGETHSWPNADLHNRREHMSTGQIGILAAIIIYLAAMVYVGFYFSKKGGGDSADEFYLGGRKLGAPIFQCPSS